MPRPIKPPDPNGLSPPPPPPPPPLFLLLLLLLHSLPCQLRGASSIFSRKEGRKEAEEISGRRMSVTRITTTSPSFSPSLLSLNSPSQMTLECRRGCPPDVSAHQPAISIQQYRRRSGGDSRLGYFQFPHNHLNCLVPSCHQRRFDLQSAPNCPIDRYWATTASICHDPASFS